MEAAECTQLTARARACIVVVVLKACFAYRSYKHRSQTFQQVPNLPVSGKQTLYDLVSRFRETGCSVGDRAVALQTKEFPM